MRDVPDPEQTPTVQQPRRSRVRRAPNFGRFMIVGGFIGFVLGLVLGSRGDAGEVSTGSAMGFMAVLLGAVGVLLAAVVAVLLDRRS